MMIWRLGILLFCSAGCTVYKPGVDREWRSFATVADVSGSLMRLEDGRNAELGGVDVHSLTPTQRSAFEQRLRELVTPEPVLVRPIAGLQTVRVDRPYVGNLLVLGVKPPEGYVFPAPRRDPPL